MAHRKQRNWLLFGACCLAERPTEMSNILKVFSPPESRDLEPKEYENCLACQVMATISCIGTGLWFSSGQVFHDDKISVEENLKKNPIWWRNSIRGFGVGLIGYGIYRGTEGLLWGVNDDDKKIGLSFSCTGLDGRMMTTP